jgi:twinkle protein
VLFGWQAIPAEAREVVITEGEIDAMSMAAYGYPALSVPFGGGPGGKQQWIEAEFERMDRFERIYLATDMDKPGDEAAEEIANRLGRHRCLRVRLPRKDANECLVDGVSAAEIERAIAQAQHLTPEGLHRPSDYVADVTRLFWPGAEDHQGYYTPYRKLGLKLMFRSSELTLWCGASGAGKSQVLSDCIVDWVKQGSRVCLCSLEMKPQQTLKRMVRQVIGTEQPPPEKIQAALEWLDGGLLIYERLGKAGIQGLLEIFAFAQAKYGCDQFVIDSLMRLGVDIDDYAAQEKTVFELVEWTVAHRAHSHLVAHSRKGGKFGGVPEIEDVKGAMEIGANAFNILTVWRNRGQEKKVDDAESEEEKAKLREETPGVLLNVAKQRNGDFEGKVGLWFDQKSYRYRSAHDGPTWHREYLPYVQAA